MAVNTANNSYRLATDDEEYDPFEDNYYDDGDYYDEEWEDDGEYELPGVEYP
jgi:hypothetical protein